MQDRLQLSFHVPPEVHSHLKFLWTAGSVLVRTQVTVPTVSYRHTHAQMHTSTLWKTWSYKFMTIMKVKVDSLVEAIHCKPYRTTE